MHRQSCSGVQRNLDQKLQKTQGYVKKGSPAEVGGWSAMSSWPSQRARHFQPAVEFRSRQGSFRSSLCQFGPMWGRFSRLSAVSHLREVGAHDRRQQSCKVPGREPQGTVGWREDSGTPRPGPGVYLVSQAILPNERVYIGIASTGRLLVSYRHACVPPDSHGVRAAVVR